jgi:hypothetical protein
MVHHRTDYVIDRLAYSRDVEQLLAIKQVEPIAIQVDAPQDPSKLNGLLTHLERNERPGLSDRIGHRCPNVRRQ